MANGTLNVALKKEWLPANPWLWLGAGLALTFGSWAWARAGGRDASDLRVIVLALGLLAAAAGVALRWHDRETVYLQRWAPQIALAARFLMGCVFLVLGLGLILFFAVSCVYGDRPEFYPGVTLLACISIAPVSLAAARRCVLRKDQQANLDADEECGVALLVAGGVCVLGWFALWTGGLDWDTLRLFLRALLGVCVVGAALATVSSMMRRLTVSVVLVLHFAGISTACLSVEPAPWLVKQSWVRLFRPYLEFMYLNNAYHFYAPEPGPSSYLWFRVIFSTPEGVDQGMWYKVPDLDEDGNMRHPVALEYQRFLAMTESGAPDAALPAAGAWFDAQRNIWVGAPELANRLNLAPRENEGINIGQIRPRHLRVPMDRYLPWAQQVRIPGDVSKALLRSFAQFVAQKFAVHPDHPDWEFKKVKIYRVVHYIPAIEWFQNNIPPTEPELYRSFYTGTYDKDGVERDREDPYLYWLLPSVRRIADDPDSEIKDYCRLHAGDPNWFRPRGEKQWGPPPDARRD